MPNNAIYQIVDQIPSGKVASYGQIASLAGLGRAARYVGYTLRNLPPDTTLPWHRVVNSKGVIALPSDSESYQQQKERLEQEGVAFSRGRIDLAIYGWVPE